jgi:putative ABC transport system ATP-binding protein
MRAMSSSNAPVLLKLDAVKQCYRKSGQSIAVLDGIQLSITRGQTCAILGASGSGKSTLLNILGLLERPAGGHFRFAHNDVMQADADQLAFIRNREIGFVFQSFNLLPRLNALENVALPLAYRGIAQREARLLAARQLRLMGLAGRETYLPADLSGGQRQRVAIARALVGKPSLILADEPTGNLDEVTAQGVLNLLLKLNRQHGVTLVMVTHDRQLAGSFERCIEVIEGRLYERGGA